MAHYAFLDKNNIVTDVITGKEEGNFDWELHYGSIRGQSCKRTSYNTHFGVHSLGGTPFRKNYAGAGYLYDSVRDAFYTPQPFASWILNEDTCEWEAPVAYPDDGTTDPGGKQYKWDEATTNWTEIE